MVICRRAVAPQAVAPYRGEFATLEIPAPVRRFVFPVVARVGGPLGLRRRFAAAPPPVNR